MKRLFAVALLLCMLCSTAFADTLVTNGGVSLNTNDLPYCTQDESALAVFFTSGSSGLGNSMKHLEEQAGSGTWLEGKWFTSGSTEEELTAWAASLGIKP